MLLSIVVPIIPDILYQLDNGSTQIHLAIDTEEKGYNASFSIKDDGKYQNGTHNSSYHNRYRTFNYDMNNENSNVGLLLASKAIVQLLMNPILGPMTNRMGSKSPMFFGTIVLFISSIMFAYGNTFNILFAARSIHGVGSSCITIGGFSMIADRYPEDKKRSKIMGFIMGGTATGVLVGYPLGSVMYDFVNQSTPFLIVASLLLVNTVLIYIFLHPRLEPERLLVGASIRKLILDPYIIVASGAICMSAFTIAVLEPALPIWLMESMSPPKWQLGTVFIPDSFGYFVGTNFFGIVALKMGRWLTAMISLLTVGVCAITIPLSTHVLQLVIPHFGLGLGIGVIDASLMPLMAHLVDTRYTALYGSVYAVAEIAVCLAYSIGPLLGGYLVKIMGFSWVMRFFGILNLLYCPLCLFLKDIPLLENEKMAINMKDVDNMNAKASLTTEGRTNYASFTNEEDK
ncbi:hypothetical protein JTE90_027122 [Oedothorax gibbosus]|uniref:Major facilitator superfamily (MFS) profile domain-containing protein n=1 Tax=Oedothorax gibbosus TaxID=931172 RepID=A0AAV6U2A6_9ARAC|nr:hypothetical protein JTE90_027122 [Oedothorax gibbosus]